MISSLRAYFELGAALFRQGRFDEALAAYDSALALRPRQPRVLLNRGQTLRKLGRHMEAAADLRAAAEADPGVVEPLTVLADLWFQLRRADEAVVCLEQAVGLAPTVAAHQASLGVALRMARRPREAIAAFRAALELDPDGLYRPYLGTCELLLGEFGAGLADFEYRREPDVVTARVAALAPRWTGQDLKGQTVLIYAEQGLGDTIMFSRYAPLLAAAGARVLFAPQPALRRLLRSLPPSSALPLEFVDLADRLPRVDFHVRTMSLPYGFGTRLDTIPAQTPYLAAEPALVAKWGERLGSAGFKIGVAWKGSIQADGQDRSFDPALLSPLARLPGVRLISLQIDDPDHDAADLLRLGIETLGPDFDVGPDAFVDAAAVIAHCDLIVSLDSAVAHLSAALAKPTWIALSRHAEWRWMMDRSDSPWHPTAQLWRQTSMGYWEDVFAAITAGVGLILRA